MKNKKTEALSVLLLLLVWFFFRISFIFLYYFYNIYLVYPYALLHHRRRRVMRRPKLSLSICYAIVCLPEYNLFDTMFALPLPLPLPLYARTFLYGNVVFFFHSSYKFKLKNCSKKKEIDMHKQWFDKESSKRKSEHEGEH